MTTTPIPLAERNCSWARALDILGDRWSLLVVREAFGGMSKFSEFERSTGAAKNILTSRLETLCGNGILRREPQREGSSRMRYVLTAKGLALFPIIVALGQWGDKWIFGADGEPVQVVDRNSGAPVQHIAVFSHDGRHLAPQDVALRPGPGASELTRRHLDRIAKVAAARDS